jgi:polyhydroxyalkanoate synthesis regulator phasin
MMNDFKESLNDEEKAALNELTGLFKNAGEAVERFSSLMDKRIQDAKNKMNPAELKEFDEICKEAGTNERIEELKREMQSLKDKLKR